MRNQARQAGGHLVHEQVGRCNRRVLERDAIVTKLACVTRSKHNVFAIRGHVVRTRCDGGQVAALQVPRSRTVRDQIDRARDCVVGKQVGNRGARIQEGDTRVSELGRIIGREHHGLAPHTCGGDRVGGTGKVAQIGTVAYQA